MLKKVILRKEVAAILFAWSVEVRDITVVKISGVSVFQVENRDWWRSGCHHVTLIDHPPDTWLVATQEG